MKHISFSDFLFGTVSFSVSEGFADEFMSFCVKKKILIHNLKREGDTLSGCIYSTELKALSSAAEKSGMKLSIIKRNGLPHLFFRYRKRYGIPVGLFLFTVITAILHSVIWSIEITPTEFIETERILEVLNASGVHVGTFSDTVNCKDTEYMLYKAFEDISWVNVRITGTRMFVDISEVKIKEKQTQEKFTNIVAAKDGEIINAEIFRGEGKLYPGTAVVKGDLLVSGIINNRDGSVRFVDSAGKIFARTKNFSASTIPMTVSIKILKSCKDVYLPSFFGLSLIDAINVKQQYFTDSCYFSDGKDIVFPLGIIRRHIYSFEESVKELTEDQAVLLCFRDFAKSCLKLRKTAEIVESDIRLAVSNVAEFSGNFICIEDIALKKEFTVEDN